MTKTTATIWALAATVWAIAAMLTLCAPAKAQSPVLTFPGASEVCPGGVSANCHNSSSTITVTNTFQSLFARNANGQRRDCLVQNNGTNQMLVYVGPIAGATAGKSFVLDSGTWFACRGTDLTVQDQISITGTSGDAFTAIMY